VFYNNNNKKRPEFYVWMHFQECLFMSEQIVGYISTNFWEVARKVDIGLKMIYSGCRHICGYYKKNVFIKIPSMKTVSLEVLEFC
jgi:hypothetical protein